MSFLIGIFIGLGTLILILGVIAVLLVLTKPNLSRPKKGASGAAADTQPAAASYAEAAQAWTRSNSNRILAALSVLVLLILVTTVFPTLLAALVAGIGWFALVPAIVMVLVVLFLLSGPWLWKLAAAGIVVLLLIGAWPVREHRPAPVAQTAPVVQVTTSNPLGFHHMVLGSQPVLVNPRGFYSVKTWLPADGCIYQRAARSTDVYGPFGYCEESIGLAGPKDVEYMWSAEPGRQLTVDIELSTPIYN